MKQVWLEGGAVVELPDDAVTLDEGVFRAGERYRYLIWAVKVQGGYHGQPAVITQVSWPDGPPPPQFYPQNLLLTISMLRKLVELAG